MVSKIDVEKLKQNNIENISNAKNVEKTSKNDVKVGFFNKLLNKITKLLSLGGSTNDVDHDAKKKEKTGLFSILKNKQFKLIVIVLFFGLLALIVLNSSFGEDLTSINKTNNDYNFTSSLEYCEKLENKLEEVLSGISGVGKVRVMVTVESGPELKLAKNTEETKNETTTGGNFTSSSTMIDEPIIVTTSSSKQPLVITELTPKITGVLVVASGAKDIGVKMNLMQAIVSLLNISTSNIQIYS